MTEPAYDNQWRHYAAVIDSVAGSMRLYHNGILTAERFDVTTAITGAQAGSTVLSLDAVTGVNDSITKIDELRIYNAALTHGQIVYLAAGADGAVTQPIYPTDYLIDINGDGLINLSDWTFFAAQWFVQ